MSDEKPKPLARIERQREHNHDRLHLFVAGRFVASEPVGEVLGEPEALPRLCDAINAAVDQREARLRVAAKEFIAASDEVFLDADRCGRDDRRRWAAAQHALEEALGGAGPDYVPAAALEAERAKTRGLWAVLNDVAHEGGLASERAAECMRALGMRTEPAGKPVHFRRGDTEGFSACPHGHGGLTTTTWALVTCSDCRQLEPRRRLPAIHRGGYTGDQD